MSLTPEQIVDKCIDYYEDEEDAFNVAEGMLIGMYKMKKKEAEWFIEGRFRLRDEKDLPF
jgi:hypothetical protein